MREERIRRPPAIANVPVVVVQPFRYRKVCHVEGEHVLLTKHTARYLVARGAVVLTDGKMDSLFPTRKYRCQVVRPGDAGLSRDG